MKKLSLIFALSIPLSIMAQLPILSLEEAVNVAIRNNFGIKIGQNDALVARNNVTKGNAGFLPSLNLTLTESPSLGLLNQKLANGTEQKRTNISNNLNAGLQMSWTLYDGKRMYYTLDRLKELQGISDLNIKIRTEQIVYDVMRAYYNIVRHQELYKGLQEQLDLYEERERLAQTRLEVGKGNQLDVLQAKADLNVQKTQLLRQKQQIDMAKLALKQVITEGGEYVFDVKDSLAIVKGLDYSLLKNNALSNSLALELLKKQGGVATLTMKEFEAQRKPRVTFNPAVTLGRQDNTAGLFLLNQTGGVNAGVTLTYPILDGDNLKRQVENSRIEIETNKIRQNELKYSLEVTLSIAYQNYLNAVEILRGEEENMRIAKQSIEIAMERYRLSRSTVLELKQIQQGYEAAVTRAVTAKYDAKSAEIDMMRISGQLVR
ncbi:MAG: TolC family protein [Saprospiraceae bacterium]|nr:TolC family protein [Saprospiraceae bacterium]